MRWRKKLRICETKRLKASFVVYNLKRLDLVEERKKTMLFSVKVPENV